MSTKTYLVISVIMIAMLGCGPSSYQHSGTVKHTEIRVMENAWSVVWVYWADGEITLLSPPGRIGQTEKIAARATKWRSQIVPGEEYTIRISFAVISPAIKYMVKTGDDIKFVSCREASEVIITKIETNKGG